MVYGAVVLAAIHFGELLFLLALVAGAITAYYELWRLFARERYALSLPVHTSPPRRSRGTSCSDPVYSSRSCRRGRTTSRPTASAPLSAGASCFHTSARARPWKGRLADSSPASWWRWRSCRFWTSRPGSALAWG